ncbi:MAG: hydantoinase B/oxoprolinase family protein [Myxococcota bacterium]
MSEAKTLGTLDAAEKLGAEIMRHALRVAAEEASIVVVKSAHSAMIVEGADACAGILDRDARLITLSTATNLMHAASLRCSLPAVIEDHPIETMAPGDVFVMNDCFRGGIHSNDLLVFRPVFLEGEVAWFTGTLIHVADLGSSSVGGIVPSATDVYAEGLQLPPVRLYQAGVAVDDMHRLLALNSRTPDRVLGDVGALVAGVHVAAERMDALAERFGAARLKQGVDAYLTGAEQRLRDELDQLAPGTYRGEYQVDGDGIEEGRQPVVRVEIEVRGAEGIRLDFTETDDQAMGAINAGFSQALTGAIYAVRCFVDPEIPMNEGCFSPVEVVFRKGSLLDPHAPAACGGRVVAVTAVCEAVVQALSQAQPERATAASSVIHPYTLAAPSGLDPWLLLSYEYGGLGARRGSDGPSATGAFFLGGRNTVPQVEALESTLPIRFDAIRLVADSGGAGQWRGGLGVETRIEVLADSELAVRSERVVLPPCGREGGADGRPGDQFAEEVDGERRPLPAKGANLPLAKGERFVLTTSGGGGLGRPEDRDRDALRRDLEEGLISQEAAEQIYGWTPGR